MTTGPLAAGQDGDAFRADIAEVARTRVVGDELVIESWHPGTGLRRVARR